MSPGCSGVCEWRGLRLLEGKSGPATPLHLPPHLLAPPSRQSATEPVAGALPGKPGVGWGGVRLWGRGGGAWGDGGRCRSHAFGAGRREAGGSRRPLTRWPNKRGLAESPGAVGAVIDSISDVSIMQHRRLSDRQLHPSDRSVNPPRPPSLWCEGASPGYGTSCVLLISLNPILGTRTHRDW